MHLNNTLKEEIDITFLITCYNEEEYIIDSIETVINALLDVGCSYEIIVIDDVSKDNSALRVREYIKDHPEYPITFHINEVNKGLPNNFLDGAFLGQGKYYRLYCGDNAEPKEAMINLLKHIGKADFVIPYQKDIPGKSFLRRMLSKAFTFLVNFVSGYNIKYYNGLPIYVRYHVMRFPPVTLGFGFQADQITHLIDEGMSYIQVERCGLIERKGSKSTAFSMRNLLSVIHSILEIAIRRVRRALYKKSMTIGFEVKLEKDI